VLAVSINPADAGPRGISDGDVVRIFNELGKVVCEARIEPRVREGVVSMPKGAWRKASVNGMTSTALCPTHLNVVGGAACFNDARVEVMQATAEESDARR
jgi:anaerobic selenocysteine-containing dehydrogenase